MFFSFKGFIEGYDCCLPVLFSFLGCVCVDGENSTLLMHLAHFGSEFSEAKDLVSEGVFSTCLCGFRYICKLYF